MSDWLSSTWEANWRSFQYFNLYRLVLAGLFFLGLLVPHDWAGRLYFSSSPVFLLLDAVYGCCVVGSLLLSIHWQRRFNFQLSIQVAIDAVVVSLFMYAAGGVSSGLGILLLISLAAASLVGRGRLVLFYAALATIAVLLTQIYGVVQGYFEIASIVQGGILSAGFFATAILARLLGQRVMANEDLARRRGEALENQIRISRCVVERMQDGVLIVGRNGAIDRTNPVAASMLGLLPNPVPSLSVLMPELAEALRVWQVGGGDSVQISAPNGREMLARFERTASSDGEVLVFLEDVGRIKARAQQMKLASLGRLTASIAHEIRNPLSAIGHAGELLREEQRGPVQERLLRILSDNVSRLDRIVQDVLGLGRQQRAEPEILALDEFCSAFVEQFSASENLPPGVVEVILDEPLTLCFDRSHLDQILWNLVSNALRHSTRGSGAVRLRVCRGSLEGRVELHMMDDGPGISPAVREQIFEPFFTTHHTGTGLGLFIARELAAANGATLDLAGASSSLGGHFILAGRNDWCQLPEMNDALSMA